jgi:hypothetical protein
MHATLAPPDAMAAVTPAALSHAQLQAALWADASVRVYALILGRNVPDLATRLAEADAARAPGHRQS